MTESCGICGGDGRITNSFGSEGRCPSCHGTGRKEEDTGFRDVTKTKPSHFKPTARPGAPIVRETGPTTHEGTILAKEVQSSGLSKDTQAKLVLEIEAYEAKTGKITQTFAKKVRKQLRPPTA